MRALTTSTYQCVVGFYFRKLGKFSAYTGSTVPWHAYMSAGKLAFNLLPPGCYIYKKGDHRPQTKFPLGHSGFASERRQRVGKRRGDRTQNQEGRDFRLRG